MKASRPYHLFFYFKHKLFWLLSSSGKIASSPSPSWSIFGFDFVCVFVCYVLVDFSVVFVEHYFGFDICPPPLCLLLPPDQVLSLPMSAGGTPTNTNDPPTITSLPETYFLHLLHGADVFFHCSFKMCLIFVTFLFTWCTSCNSQTWPCILGFSPLHKNN